MKLLTAIGFASLLVTFAPAYVDAQQPLKAFLAAAEKNSLDAREAKAGANQADWQTAAARARILPSINAQASYTRNENEVAVEIPFGAMPITAVITPYDQWDARATLTVPIIDLGAWATLAQTGNMEDVAAARSEVTRQSVQVAVVQLWHQLVATRALVTAANQNFEAVKSSRENVSVRESLGSATRGDLARADAELARAKQSLEDAKLQATLTSKSITNLTGLTPTDDAVSLEDNLATEKPIQEFTKHVKEQPAVRAAEEELAASQAGRNSGWLNLLPTLTGNATERWTNAAGFGPKDNWTLSLVASWLLDFGKPAAIGAQNAALDGAEVRAERAQQNAEYAIFEAWHRVESLRARAEAALAAEQASIQSADDTRSRFELGAATQLEHIQADRDLFAAQVARIQAIAELRAAREILRIRSDKPTKG